VRLISQPQIQSSITALKGILDCAHGREQWRTQPPPAFRPSPIHPEDLPSCRDIQICADRLTIDFCDPQSEARLLREHSARILEHCWETLAKTGETRSAAALPARKVQAHEGRDIGPERLGGTHTRCPTRLVKAAAQATHRTTELRAAPGKPGIEGVVLHTYEWAWVGLVDPRGRPDRARPSVAQRRQPGRRHRPRLQGDEVRAWSGTLERPRDRAGNLPLPARTRQRTHPAAQRDPRQPVVDPPAMNGGVHVERGQADELRSVAHGDDTRLCTPWREVVPPGDYPSRRHQRHRVGDCQRIPFGCRLPHDGHLNDRLNPQHRRDCTRIWVRASGCARAWPWSMQSAPGQRTLRGSPQRLSHEHRRVAGRQNAQRKRGRRRPSRCCVSAGAV
jgi:hypothetical protein